jgi:hypothetical protein
MWHGCTAEAKNGIEAKGVDLALCRVDTDFGRGFYTTTVERQARQWAWSSFYDWQKDNPTKTGNQPIVLRFRMRRHGIKGTKRKADEGLDRLPSLHFVRGDFDSEDYWSLVQHCRQSMQAAGGRPAVVNDHRRPPNGWYAVVTGPVSAFWRQRVAMEDADQVSFHTVAGIDILNALIESGMKGDREAYRWEPIVP